MNRKRYKIRTGEDAKIHPVEVVDRHQGMVYWAASIEGLKQLYTENQITLAQFEDLLEELDEFRAESTLLDSPDNGK